MRLTGNCYRLLLAKRELPKLVRNEEWRKLYFFDAVCSGNDTTIPRCDFKGSHKCWTMSFHLNCDLAFIAEQKLCCVRNCNKCVFGWLKSIPFLFLSFSLDETHQITLLMKLSVANKIMFTHFHFNTTTIPVDKHENTQI